MEHDKEQETTPEKINQLEPKSNRLIAFAEFTHGDGPVDKTSQKRFIKVKNKVKSLRKSRIKVKKRRSGHSTSSKSSSSSLGLSSSLDGEHKQKFYRVKKEKVFSGVNKRKTKVKKRKTPIEASTSSSAKSTTSTKSISATEKEQQPIDKNANSSNFPSESCKIELSTKSVDSEHSLCSSESSKKKKPVVNETLEKKTKKIKEPSPSSSEKSYCSVSTKKPNKTIEGPSKDQLTEGTLPLESSLIRLESPSSVLSNSSTDLSETSISCDLSYRESSKEAVCKGKKAHSKKSDIRKSFIKVKRRRNSLTSSDEDICVTSVTSFKSPREETEKKEVENVQKTFYRMRSTKVNTSSRQLVKVKHLKSAPVLERSQKKMSYPAKGNKPIHSPGGQPVIRVLETALEVTEPSLVESCSEKTEKSLKVDAQTQEFSKIIEEGKAFFNFSLNLANDNKPAIVSEQGTKKEETNQKGDPKEQTVETSKVAPKELSAFVSKAQVSVTTGDITQSYSPGISSRVSKEKNDKPDAKSLADKLTLSGTKQNHDDDLVNGKEILQSIKQTAESTSRPVEKNNKLVTEMATSSSDIVCPQENKSAKFSCNVPPVPHSPNALIGNCASTNQLTTDLKETQSKVSKEQTKNKSNLKATIDNDQIVERHGGSKEKGEHQEGRQGKNPKAYHVTITMDCQLNIDELKSATSEKEPHSKVVSLVDKQNLLLQKLNPSDDLPQAEEVPQVPSLKLTDTTVHTTAPEDSQKPSGEVAANVAHSAGSKQVDAQEANRSLASTLVVVTVIAFATFLVAKAFLRWAIGQACICRNDCRHFIYFK